MSRVCDRERAVKLAEATGADGRLGGRLRGALAAFAVLLLGFLGLAVARVRSAPWRPLRMALGIAAVISFFLLTALPFPPGGWDAANVVLWATVLITSIAASYFADRAPWLSGVLLVPLGIAACAIDYRVVSVLADRSRGVMAPAMTLSFVIAASTGAASLSALWHGRALLAEIPRARRLL